MTDFDPDDYAAELDDAETRAEVDVVFAGIAALSKGQMKQVLDLVAENTLRDLATGMLSPSQLLHAQATVKLADDVAKTPEGAIFLKKLEAENEAPANSVVLVQVAINLGRLQGDAVHPVLRALADEAVKMEDAQLKTMNGMFRLAARVGEKMNLIPQPPKAVTEPVKEEAKPQPKKTRSQNFDL